MDQAAAAPLQEYKDDKVAFTVDHKRNCIVEFHVKVSPAFAKEAYQRALKAVRKEVSMPGFRKGKAPEQMVIKKFGTEIDKQWQQEIGNGTFPACEKLAKIPIVQKDSKINFSVKSHSLENGAEVDYSFETEPAIPTVDPKHFALQPVKRPDVSDKTIDETMRQLLFFFAEWKKVEERPVQEGDFVLLDVDVIETDPSSSLFADTRFEVTDAHMAKWMKSLVLGQSKGAILEGVSQPDEETAEAKEAFPPKKVRVTIKEVEEAALPSLNENLLKLLGVASEEELRTNVTKLLSGKADAHVLEEQRTQAIAYLLEQHPFDLPQSLIIKETQFRLRQLFNDPEFQKHWQSLSDLQRNETVEAIKQQSEKAVKMFYLCRKVVKDAGLKVNPEDLPKPPTTPLEVLLKPLPDSFLHQEDELREAEAYSRLILEKAQDYLIAQASESPSLA